jgi:hypothetical protein
MTKHQLSEALTIARSDADLSERGINTGPFWGFGLPDFVPTFCTIESLAALIRWQCVYLNGGIDTEALNEIARIGRHKFIVV